MNSIKRLQIENFQSHVKTIIVPATNGQLTVITGPSDAGKTVILRALRWLLFNEPQGTDFIRVGASFARVTVELESGHTVIRERTKSTNRYKIVAPETTEPQVFEGFGSSVPLEVQELTGVRPVKIGDLELNLNLAEQLDGPFLGRSISAGARAKVLGKLAGTEEIDFAAKQLGTDLYRRNQDEKRLAGEVAELEEEIRKYDWLPTAKAKIEALEQLVERIKAAQERKNKLSQFKEQIIQFDEKITGCHAVLYRWRNLEQAEERAVNIVENQRSKEMLVKLVNNYWTFEKSIWACEKIIKQYAWLPEAERKLQVATEGIDRAKRLRNLKANYLSAQETIRKSQRILSNLQGIDRAGELTAGIQEKIVQRDILERLARSYGKTGMLITQEQVKVEALQQFAEVEKLLQAAGEKRRRWEKLVIMQDKYASLSGLIEDTRGKVVMWENRIAELQGAYQDELAAAGICPLCGQAIDYQKIKEAV
ncbi:MAG: AAA family ATPase [Porticoccaceae bacterium]